jgi:hypothetical protein
MRVRTQIFLICLAICAIAVVLAFVRHINGPRIIARTVAPDGTEFCVLQTCNWGGEPFTTSCYYRKLGGRWGWFYYDHEDWYWDRGTTQIDESAKRISVIRDGKPTATFDWDSETFRLLQGNTVRAETVGAQTWMPIGWDVQ